MNGKWPDLDFKKILAAEWDSLEGIQVDGKSKKLWWF